MARLNSSTWVPLGAVGAIISATAAVVLAYSTHGTAIATTNVRVEKLEDAQKRNEEFQDRALQRLDQIAERLGIVEARRASK